MYTLTITVTNEYTRETVSDAISRVYYNDGSQDVDLQPVSPGVYSCPEGAHVFVNFAKTGFQSSTGDVLVNADNTTFAKSMVPDYTWRYSWMYLDDTGRRFMSYDTYKCTLYSLQNDEWVQIEQHSIYGQYSYFTTAFDASTQYKIVMSDTYWSREATFLGSEVSSVSIGNTWRLSSTACKCKIYDARSGAVITGATQTRSSQTVKTNQEYSGNWSNRSINLYCPDSGTILNRSAAGYKTRIKYNIQKTGYYDYEHIEDFGENSVRLEEYVLNAQLEEIPKFIITPVANRTGENIQNFTATVTKNGATIETSTNGKFYEAWDGASTYTLTIQAEGYQDYTENYVEYPSGNITMYEPVAPVTFTATDNVSSETITPDTITVVEHDSQEPVAPEQGVYYLELGVRYDYTIAKTGYDTVTGTITRAAVTPYVESIVLDRIPQTAAMTVTVTDERHGTEISDATITVTNTTTGDVLTPVSGIYYLTYNYGYSYSVSVTKSDYVSFSDTLTPDSETAIAENVELEKILQYCKLYVTAKNAKDETVDAAIVVYDEYDHAYIAKSDDHWNLICNDSEPYHVEISADGYYDYTGDTFVPDSEDDITLTVTLDKIPVYATLYVTAEDEETLEEIPDADIDVYDITAHEYIEKTGIFWKLLAEEDHEYRVDISHPDYYDYAEQFEAPEAGPIFKTCKMIARPTFATLTVEIKDADTKEIIPDADITVRNETKGEIVEPEDNEWLLQTGDDNYRIYVSKTGYTDAESVIFQAPEEADIYKVLYMNTKLEPFATVSDLSHRTGISYTTAEKERLSYLLEDVSNLIRSEGRKCGVDVDAKVSSDRIYASIVKTVTCDVTQRVMRQSMTGDAMSQESQSALGYTWSGTYAIPGGGTAMSLMRNEKDILGFDAMTIGVIDLC